MSRIVAIIGAECSGKSALAGELAAGLGGVVVPEYLRTFVAQAGRVPSAQEQITVMRHQIAAERRAATAGGWVVSDAGALMTAVYSLLYYEDDSLVATAVEHHRTAYAATVWCDIDIPWVADAGQRDGTEYRQRGHGIIAEIVRSYQLDVLSVGGTLRQRAVSVRRALAE